MKQYYQKLKYIIKNQKGLTIPEILIGITILSGILYITIKNSQIAIRKTKVLTVISQVAEIKMMTSIKDLDFIPGIDSNAKKFWINIYDENKLKDNVPKNSLGGYFSITKNPNIENISEGYYLTIGSKINENSAEGPIFSYSEAMDLKNKIDDVFIKHHDNNSNISCTVYIKI